jgi:hypothetical protein
MVRIAFPIMGAFVLLFAAGVLAVTILWIGHYSLHVPGEVNASGVIYSAFLIVALAVMGLGLIYLRKWAALLFSVLTAYAAFWAFKDTLRPSHVPGEWTWLGYIFGLLLIAPAILTAMNWRMLVWRRPPKSFDIPG